MTNIVEHGARFWRNYHGSVAHDVQQLAETRFDTPQAGMTETLAVMARALQQFVGRARVAGTRVSGIGSGWSFTDLVAGDECLLGLRMGDGGPCANLALVWPVGPMAATAVRAALDGAGIPYGLHWGKLGGIDAAKVAADHGAARTHWRAARRRLLGPAMRCVIGNPALSAWGLN